MCLGNFDYSVRTLNSDPAYSLYSKINDMDSCELDDYCNYIDCDRDLLTSYGMRILHLNARSIVKKFSELCELINHFHPDAVLVCETWLHENNVNLLNISNYEFFYKNRKNGKGGGVAIYINSKLNPTAFDPGVSPPDCIECVFATYSSNMVIGELYRKPNTSEKHYLKYLRDVCDVLNKSGKSFVLGTDQNIDMLKISNQNVKELFNIMSRSDMTATILKPTRITNSSATLIDQIYLSEKLFRNVKSHILLSDISDHFPCMIDIQCKIEKYDETVEYVGRDLSDLNINRLIDYLNCFTWENLNMMSVNDSYNMLMTVLKNGMDIYMPEKLIKIKKHKVIRERWMTRNLVKCTNKSKHLYQKYCKTRLEIDQIRYTEYRNVLNKTKKTAKFLYYNEKFVNNRGNMKQSWKILNQILGKCNDKTSVISYLEVNGIRITDKRTMCESFNNHFGSVGQRYSSKIPHSSKSFEEYLGKKNENNLKFQSVTPNEILVILKSICNKNSAGHDDLSNVFVKKLSNGIATPLCYIINKSLHEHTVPVDMKLAKIHPLYKAGTKSLITNYRPISLLPVFSKVLEKVIYQQTSNFFEIHNIIDTHQFGFRPNHSCSDCLLKFVHDIHKNDLLGNHSISIHADLSKAFDTLIRKNLFRKLEHYGLRDDTLAWFIDYFTDRKQYVKLGVHRSNNYDLDFGVGQGSILGPLIFQVAINDIYRISKYSTIIGFADDTTMYHSYHNVVTLKARIKNDLRILIDWFRANKMSFNASKTHMMIFSRNQLRGLDCIDVGDNSFKRTNIVKFLGVLIDDRLSFNAHVDHVLSKINLGLHNLKHTKYLLPKFVKKQIYYSFIYSHMIYGIEAWIHFISEKNCKLLNNKVKQSVRLIANLSNNDNVNTTFKSEKTIVIQ